MKEKTSAPTMKDVALEAGVALGTVSRVFNNLPVGESYRLRVEEAARKLGYQVNSYARGLRASRTGTVSLILPGLTDPFFAALAQHVCTCLDARGYRTLLALTGGDGDTERQCVRMAEQNRADGILGVLYGPGPEAGQQTPWVSIGRYVNLAVPCVASDSYGGGQMAAEKLLALGCRKLLFLHTGRDDPGEADRLGSGFAAACRQRHAGHAVLQLQEQVGCGPLRDYLQGHCAGETPEFDGIFCSTDRLACTAVRMLRETGVQVPEDVQVIGYGGSRQFGDGELYCSAIVQPVPRIARTAVDLLLEEDPGRLPSVVCLPVSYAPGGTTRE